MSAFRHPILNTILGRGLLAAAFLLGSATPAEGWQPPAGKGVDYRAQLLDRGVPLFDFTPAKALMEP